MFETTKQCCALCRGKFTGPCPCICHTDWKAAKREPSFSESATANYPDAPSDFRERFKEFLIIPEVRMTDIGVHSNVILDFIATVRQGGVEEGRKQVIEEVFKVEAEKWQDVEHCACLGYALVQISGGEDSEGGQAMEKRLADLLDSLSK